MSEQDPTCSVTGCSRPNGGTLTFANRGGGFRVSACDKHGWRAAQGEWYVFDVMGRRYALGGRETPPYFAPLRASIGGESWTRTRHLQQLAALRLYEHPDDR